MTAILSGIAMVYHSRFTTAFPTIHTKESAENAEVPLSMQKISPVLVEKLRNTGMARMKVGKY